MFKFLKYRTIKGISAFVVLSLFLSACNLPIPGDLTQAPTAISGVSDAMLTAAAATINAHFNEQSTPQPESTEIQPVETQPPAEQLSLATTEVPVQSTESSQVSPSATPEAIQQATDSSTTSETAQITVVPVTIVPEPAEVVQYGSQFKIKNINLHPCSGGYHAIFKIYNQSSDKLESLNLHLQDLSTGAILLGSWQSDAPFMNTDRTCAIGNIDMISSGQTLFLGNSLGGSKLSGHTIRATILLCSKESLGGNCTQKVIDFIVP